MLYQPISIQSIAIDLGEGCFAGAIAGSLPPKGFFQFGNLLKSVMVEGIQRTDLSNLEYRHFRRSGKYRLRTSVQAAG
ncbi:MAG: hypothetical protein MJA27_07725 [Pseudanabaenales cyanobacterium]|nr:hypothetical protein [Pseudanabaenales cyanobacterium]